MASDINRVILVGRLVRDPEVKYTSTGTPIANFSIANNRSYQSGDSKKETVSFFNCIAWNKLGEVVAQYCKKGNRIGIEGRLQQRSWDDQGTKRTAVEIVVENIQFLDTKKDNSTQNNSTQYTDNPISDEDIPF